MNKLETAPAKKGNCPQCGQKGCFRYFEDFPGDSRFGRCDRENNCGFFVHPGEDEAPVVKTASKPKVEMHPIYLDPKNVLPILERQDSNLHIFCRNLAISDPEREKWDQHLRRWNIGTEVKYDRLETVFVFQDIQGRYCNRKNGLYNPRGKRDKELKFYSLIQPEKGNLKYTLCLFGEHLLSEDKTRPVCVVESEKTAVIVSFYYPQLDWVSCGAANGLTVEKMQVLYGRPVWWLCDADKAGRDNSSIKHISVLENYATIDLFPARKDGWDIADEIIEGNRPEIKPGLPGRESALPKMIRGDLHTSLLATGGLTPEQFADLEEYGLYAGDDNCFYVEKQHGQIRRMERASNFIIEVPFHIHDKIPKRIVYIRNTHGQERRLDVDTAAITSLSKFKEFTEGLGNFIFEGNSADHQKLKRKIFRDEKSCTVVATLGWYKEGFYVFSNGAVFQGEFIQPDSYGIIQIKKETEDEKNEEPLYYYIPSANKDKAKIDSAFINERRFRHNPSNITFEVWANQFYTVYREPGMVGIMFALASLFSDHVYNSLQYFPIAFLYGEGGSGKGSLIKSLQRLWGQPQDPLTLLSRANTDKAKIRNLAQFCNTMILLEEYTNSLGADTVQYIKNLWDRYGYKRANMDSGYSTDTVPINSSVMVTGNEYPMDDPLLQRLIVLEIDQNEFTQHAKDAFNRLADDIESKGITSITVEILAYRQQFVSRFREVYKAEQRKVADVLKGIKVTDRMTGNCAVLTSTFTILHEEGVKFPFTHDTLLSYLHEVMKAQNGKRDVGGEVQKFWDVVNFLANDRKIRHGREFKIDGNEVYIRFKEIHSLYLKEHSQMFRTPGLSSATMLDKLRKSDAYKQTKDQKRFDDKKTSAHVFALDKIGIDLTSIVEYNKQEEAKYALKGEKEREVSTATVTDPKKEKQDDLPF